MIPALREEALAATLKAQQIVEELRIKLHNVPKGSEDWEYLSRLQTEAENMVEQAQSSVIQLANIQLAVTNIKSLFLAKIISVSGKNIRYPAGHFMMKISNVIYSKKTFELIFVQLIADLREEHSDALLQGHLRHAKWIVFRGWLHFGLTVVSHAFSTIAKLFIKIWKLTP